MIKRLFYTIVVLVSLLTVLLLTAVYLSVENTATVAAPAALSSDDVERMRELISANKPAAVVSTGKMLLKVTNEEANELLRFASQSFEKNVRASVNFSRNRLHSNISYQLPSNPVGRFVNLKVTLEVSYAKYFDIKELKVGPLVIPSFVLQFIQPTITEYLKQYYGSYFVLWKQVKRIDITDNDMTVYYQIQRTDYKQLRGMIKKVIVDDAMRERITAYSVELDRIINRLDTGQQSVINILSPMFSFAEKRSLLNNQTREENKIALLTLAAYSIGKNPLTFITDEPIKKRKQITFTLKGRSDLTKHYLISSAINAMSDASWSNAIGLRKELKDANGGSGFSFVDLMADIAGNKLADAALSPSRAAVLQSRMSQLRSEDDIMGDIAGLPEKLDANEFRMEYGNVSSEEYIQMVREIERRLFRCSVYRR